MLKINGIIWCFLFIFNYSSFAQNDSGFQFHNTNKKKYKIKFINYNNLIIIEAKLNGIEMNFLLDTGVDKTVLFGIEGNEEEIKKNSKKILIKGVSGKKKAYAYKNENNTIEIGKFKDPNHSIYVIFDKAFNISDKIGYQIQGVLGYNFFKNHIVKINYIRNHLKVYHPKNFSKSLRNYDNLKLSIIEQKPYVKTKIKQETTFIEYIFLLDIGSGDSIWLKQQSEEDPPEKSFYDILGYGFADFILGYRSKAKAFKLGSKLIEKPKIAYPDSLSYEGLKFTANSGVIGSEIMRRFHWYFDYTNRTVYFKPNSDISDPFNYDMSGLVLKYDGYQAIAEYQSIFNIKVKTNTKPNYNKIEDKPELKIEMRPILKVGAVRPNSSGYEAGFVEGDEIIKIDGKYSYKFTLEEISKLLSSKEGRRINFEMMRNGSIYNKTIILKSRFLE